MCTWLARSIALHPDKVTVATGQVAGHDKTAGKVCIRMSITFQLHPPCPAAFCPLPLHWPAGDLARPDPRRFANTFDYEYDFECKILVYI